MSSTEESAQRLRATQKPLKDKYTSDPSSALVTLSSSGTLDPTNLTCSLSSAGAAAKRVAGLHAAAGGGAGRTDGDAEIVPDISSELCSGDMLLESLVACFGVTLRAVGTAMALPLRGGRVTAEGDLDFRGTMGVKDPDDPERRVPVGFQRIRIKVQLDFESDQTRTDKKKVEKLISLSERYCVVLQTLRAGVDVVTELAGGETAVPDKDDLDKNETEMQVNEEEKLPDEDVLRLN